MWTASSDTVSLQSTAALRELWPDETAFHWHSTVYLTVILRTATVSVTVSGNFVLFATTKFFRKLSCSEPGEWILRRLEWHLGFSYPDKFLEEIKWINFCIEFRENKHLHSKLIESDSYKHVRCHLIIVLCQFSHFLPTFLILKRYK